MGSPLLTLVLLVETDHMMHSEWMSLCYIHKRNILEERQDV